MCNQANLQVLTTVTATFYLFIAQCQISGNALENALTLTSGCTCPGCTVTYECTVVGRPTGITLWRGSALDNCRGQEISLLHYQFTSVRKTCNNGSIVAKGQELDSVNGSYTSQLNITVTCDMIGKTVECIHDDIQNITTVDSFNITVPDLQLPQNISVDAKPESEKITFIWTQSISECSAVQYRILALNCGTCPNTTTITTATCTDIPNDNIACTFTVQLVVCGNIPLGNGEIAVQLKYRISGHEIAITCITLSIATMLFIIILLVKIRRSYVQSNSKTSLSQKQVDITDHDQTIRIFDNKGSGIYSDVCNNFKSDQETVLRIFDNKGSEIYSDVCKNFESDQETVLRIFDNKTMGMYGLEDNHNNEMLLRNHAPIHNEETC